ncbi:hypothetical protein ACFLUC_01660 [Chloroflexota bacterium]
MNKIHTTLFSTLALVLLLSTSIVYASEGTAEIGSASQAHCNFASSAYAGSGEFSAEPLIESATLESLEESATLAICLESQALSRSSGSFSGDDAYDVAAISAAEFGTSSNPELSVAQFTTDVTTLSAETKDCLADCYDNY